MTKAKGGLSDAEFHALPAGQALVLEVLAARARLGEPEWSIYLNRGVLPILRKLQDRGLVKWRTHPVPRTVYASLTLKGRQTMFSVGYVSPLERGVAKVLDQSAAQKQNLLATAGALVTQLESI